MPVILAHSCPGNWTKTNTPDLSIVEDKIYNGDMKRNGSHDTWIIWITSDQFSKRIEVMKIEALKMGKKISHNSSTMQ